jgi:type II secretory pathway component GspD/PulD (secretin)
MRCVYTLVAAAVVGLAATIGWADEPPAGRLVVLEVLVADVGGAAVGEGEVTAAKVLELAAQGKLDSASKIQMSALENVPSTVTFSETVPVETGRMFGPAGDRGGGRQMGTYNMQNHGTTIQATARVEQGGAILVEMQAERSRLVTGRAEGEEAGAANIAATKTTQARVQTTTRLASGKPAIVGSQAAGSGKDAVHTYFVLTATAAEGGKTAAVTENPPVFLALSHARAVDLLKTLRPILEGRKVIIAADERSNSLIVTATPEVLEIIRALIAQLDASPTDGGAAAAPVTKIVALSHAKAVELVETLQAVLQGQRVKLTADPRTNTVILQGSPEVLDPAISLISRLDESE